MTTYIYDIRAISTNGFVRWGIRTGETIHDLSVRLRVNGATKQVSNTSEFIVGIEYISGVMTLYSGDVISIGTPGGVGIFRDPPELLEPDDTVSAKIMGIALSPM